MTTFSTTTGATTKTPAATTNEIEGSAKAVPFLDTETDYVDRELDREIKRAHIKTLQDNNDQRRRYAVNTFLLTCCWIAVVIIIVILNGCGVLHLSDTVLVTLVTTTTASVFGFFLLVMKYLFNPEFEKPKTGTGAGTTV
jgi:hypothetical protein